ncbi:MAG: hypothetical protein KKF44_08665 [Nanoarchaeota archaeon]|nr:hypothetical protein [Nanoarchaeota archaeon]
MDKLKASYIIFTLAITLVIGFIVSCFTTVQFCESLIEAENYTIPIIIGTLFYLGFLMMALHFSQIVDDTTIIVLIYFVLGFEIFIIILGYPVKYILDSFGFETLKIIIYTMYLLPIVFLIWQIRNKKNQKTDKKELEAENKKFIAKNTKTHLFISLVLSVILIYIYYLKMIDAPEIYLIYLANSIIISISLLKVLDTEQKHLNCTPN